MKPVLLAGGAWPPQESALPPGLRCSLAASQPREGRQRRGARALTGVLCVAEEGAYDEYENDLGITAIALYDYQAGEKGARAPRGRAAAVPPSLPHRFRNGDFAAFSKLLERVNAVQRVPGFPSLNRLRAAGCPVPLKSPNRDTATEAVSSKSAESLLRPPHLQRPSRLPAVPRTLWSWSCLGLAPVPSHPTRSSPPAAPQQPPAPQALGAFPSGVTLGGPAKALHPGSVCGCLSSVCPPPWWSPLSPGPLVPTTFSTARAPRLPSQLLRILWAPQGPVHPLRTSSPCSVVPGPGVQPLRGASSALGRASLLGGSRPPPPARPLPFSRGSLQASLFRRSSLAFGASANAFLPS